MRIVLNIPSSLSDDHQPMIQEALEIVNAAGGGTVYIPDGTHMIGPSDNADGGAGQYSLKLGNNVHLQLGKSVTLKRRFKNGGAAGATIRNKEQTTGNSNIKVSGGTIEINSSTCRGKHLGFQFVDYLAVDGVRFKGVKDDWNAEFHDCNDVRVTGVVMNSGTGEFEDGLHFSGGQRIVVSDCLIRCGDDALAFVNNSSCGPTTDVVVSNCYLFSRYANALKIQVESGTSPDEAPIRRVSINNIVAKSGEEIADVGAGINITDITNAAQISDVEIDGFWLDASESYFFPIEIRNVKRVRLSRVVVWHPRSRCVINGSEDVELLDCVVDEPQVNGIQCVWVGESGPCSNVRLRGGTYRGAKQWGLLIGSESHAVTGFQVSNVRLIDGTVGTSALAVANASKGLVTGNRIVDNMAGYGIQEHTPSNNNCFIANRLTGNAQGLTFVGSISQAIRNVAESGKTLKDSGGFRQTIDGWSKDGVGPHEPNEELPRDVGRFRAVRDGFITGLVVTSSLDAIDGLLTVLVYKNTGLAGAGGGPTGLMVQLEDTLGNTQRRAVTAPRGLYEFAAGDELYLVYNTTTDWDLTVNVRCAIEIED